MSNLSGKLEKSYGIQTEKSELKNITEQGNEGHRERNWIEFQH